MVSFKKLFFLTSAVTASVTIQKRTTIAEVQNDVTAIDTGAKALTIAVDSYNGGYLASLPLLRHLTTVYGTLYKGVIDSDLLPSSISDTDAFSLKNHVNQTLVIDNPIAIRALEAKKHHFQEEGLDGMIVAALGLLRAGHDASSFNALQRVPADAVEPAKEVIEVIEAALQDGIDTFEAKNRQLVGRDDILSIASFGKVVSFICLQILEVTSINTEKSLSPLKEDQLPKFHPKPS